MEQFDFKSWILSHDQDKYKIIDEGNTVRLTTDYGEAVIQFTPIEDQMLVEFVINVYKDNSVAFYLHFELVEEDHAKKLYNEMTDSLLALENKKTLQVLLSCSSGLTTAMFAEMLNENAKQLGLDYHFDAVSYMAIYEEIDQYDALMIAPQIGYMLDKLKANLPGKLVLQIPTAVFAGYNAMEGIKYLNSELDLFNENKKKKKEVKCCCCKNQKNILSIAIVHNYGQSTIDYRFYSHGEITDSNRIMKPNYEMQDILDIIDTMLLKYQHIDIVGIASPGIIDKTGKLSRDDQINLPIQTSLALKQKYIAKYDIDFYLSNNANAAVVGFALQHPEYTNILYHSQPFGLGSGGQGLFVNGKLVEGINGLAGEIRFFIERMQFSNKLDKLAYSEQGVMELVVKSLLPSISIFGPEAVALRSRLTPDIEEVKKALKEFLPEEFMPEFYYIDDVASITLDGLMQLCNDYDQNKGE